MNEELQKYYGYLKANKADVPPDYETFEATLQDEGEAKKYFDYLKANKFDTPETYEVFSETFGLQKKKVQSPLDLASKGQTVFQELGQPLADSSTQPSQSTSTKQPDRQTTVTGDMLRSLKSASLRALGGVTGAPMFISNTLHGVTTKPILKAMGASDEEADAFINFQNMTSSAGQAFIGGEEAQQRLIEKAKKADEKIAPIEGSIWDNIKEGKLGNAGELLGRGVMQSIPYLAMTAATAGGGTPAVLGTIGATSASQQYGELEGTGIKESKRKLNSWMYGGFEAAGELVTAGLLRGVGKMFRQGMAKQVDESFVKKASKEIAKGFGLEGSSEGATQIGQNLTDIITGVDPEKNILTGVLDAILIGGVSGGGIGTVGIGAHVLGKLLASDKETSRVQDNFKQQEVLINQIESTDSDPVKNALIRSVKDLKVQADEVMEANYELAKKLSPEKQSQVAELYSVWNEIQGNIDEGKYSKDEVPVMEKTVQGIKDQIQGIKDELVKELEEKEKAKEQGEKKPKETPKTETTEAPKEETPKVEKEVTPKSEFPEGYTAEFIVRPVKGSGVKQDKVEVKNEKGEVMGTFDLKTKVVDGEAYYEGGLLTTRPEFEGNGLGQNMVKLAMESLPEEYKGLYFPAETIINKTQIPRIFEKLGKIYNVSTNEKGDVFIKPKAQAEVAEGGTETNVEQTATTSAPTQENVSQIKQELPTEDIAPKADNAEISTKNPVELSLEEKHGSFTVESLNERAKRFGLSDRDMGTDVIDRILNAKEIGLSKEVDAIPKEEWDQLRVDAYQLRNKKERIDAREESVKSEDNSTPPDAMDLIDVIALDPHNRNKDKYRKELKDKFNIDFDDVYKDEQYLKDANLNDIKSKKDFLNFDNYVKYGEDISRQRGFLNDNTVPLDLQKARAVDLSSDFIQSFGKKHGFTSKIKEYSGEGNLAEVLGNEMRHPSSLGTDTFIHELGHVIQDNLNYTGIASAITHASSSYFHKRSHEVFAENFLNFFLNPIELNKKLPEVYAELDKVIPTSIKVDIRDLLSKNASESTNSLLQENTTETKPVQEIPTLSEKDFNKKYTGQHKDMRSKSEEDKDATQKKIQDEGFKSSYVNVIPISKGGKPQSVTERNYGNKKGDRVYLVPKEFLKDTPNGLRIKDGWKPTDDDIVTIEYDGQSTYEAYVNKQKGNPVQETKVFTLREQTPEAEQTPTENTPLQEKPIENNPVEPLKDSSDSIVPPTGDNGSQTPKSNHGKERERAYLSRIRDEEKTSPQLKKAVEKHGVNYRQIPNHVSRKDADYLVAFNGLTKMWKAVQDMNNGMPDAVRASILNSLVFHYDQLGIEAEKEGNKEEAQNYFEKALEIAVFTDSKSQGAGRFIQYLGSEEVTMMLSPKSNVAKVKKELRSQRDDKLQKKIEELSQKVKDLEQANKDIVEEIIKLKAYKAVKDRVTKKEGEEKPDRKGRTIDERIKKERDYRKQRWADFNKASGTLSASAIGLNKEQIEILGDIAVSVVREGAVRVEQVIKRIQAEYKKYSKLGGVISDEDIKKILPKEVDGKPLDDVFYNNEISKAKDRLAKRVELMLADKKAKKDDPVKQLIDTLFGKVQEGDTKEKEKTEQKSALEKIRESIENKDNYAKVWEDAKTEVQSRIDNNADLSDDQKKEYSGRLQKFYDEIIGKPYSEKQVKDVTKKALQDLDANIDQIVKEHYTVQDVMSLSLQDKLIAELGIEGVDAKLLADAVDKEFRKIATAKKLSILRRGMKPRDVRNPKQAKEEWQKLIELTNLGAFSEAEFAEAYADAWGFPKLNTEQAKELERLAQRVYDKKSGYKQYEAVQDMLNYIAKLPGIDLGEVAMGVWYANVLSGERTQFKNFFGNTINFFFEWGTSFVKALATGKFQLIPYITLGAGKGFQKGAFDFAYVWNTGYSPIRQGKIETSNVMEQWHFKGLATPLNYVKYVSRLMVATDTFFYSGLKEFRAYELAMREARKTNQEATNPTMSDWAKANEILANTTERREDAEKKAKDEGLTGTEFHKRVWEIMEEGRSETIVHGSNDFASRGTYNYKPEGGLGMATAVISYLADNFTFRPNIGGKTYSIKVGKLLVPFTRIIANVGNTALDYTPMGLVRAAQGSIGLSVFEENTRTKGYYRELTSEERWRIFTKSMMGVAAYAYLFLMSEPPDDEDKEPRITITANGLGDYAKNEELKKQPGGWQPYSIKKKGTWYSYQYTPLFLVLAPLGWLRDEQKYQKDKFDEKTVLDLIAGSMWKSIAAMSDMTWMTTVAGLMESLSAKDESTFEGYWKRTSTSAIKGFIYPKIVEQTKQIIDEQRENPRKYSSSFYGKILKDTPFLTNKFPVQYNAFGEPVIFDAVQMLEVGTSDPYAKYIAKYLYSDGKTIGIPSQKEKANMIYDEDKKVERAMNDIEYMDYVREIGLRTKSRIMTELMPKTNLTKEEIQKEIESIKTSTRKQVKTELFGWGEYRTKYPDRWEVLRKNRAIQIPIPLPKEKELSSAVKWKTDEGEVSATREEVQSLNEKAMDLYYESVTNYLEEQPDKTVKSETTGEYIYLEVLHNLWINALTGAKGQIIEGRVESNSQKPK